MCADDESLGGGADAVERVTGDEGEGIVLHGVQYFRVFRLDHLYPGHTKAIGPVKRGQGDSELSPYYETRTLR